MNIKAVGFYIGHVLRLLAAMMLPPLLIAFLPMRRARLRRLR